MSNKKRVAIISLAAIAGSQVISLLTVQSIGNSSQAGTDCGYHLGDLGRTAERLGYQANLRVFNPEYPANEPEQSRNVPISGTTASLPTADQPVDVAANNAPVSGTIAPTNQINAATELDRQVAAVNAEVLAGTYRAAGGN